MASVTGMTAAAIEELMNLAVVGGEIDGDGQLILTTRGGTEINAGSVSTVSATLLKAYPVGSIRLSTSSLNPADASQLGFGTWVRWGQGRVPVSQDPGDVLFDAVEETGGAKTHTLTVAQLPGHAHGMAHTHPYTLSYDRIEVDTGVGSARVTGVSAGASREFDSTGTTAATATVETTSIGGGEAHSILQPYIVCYMWKRTV